MQVLAGQVVRATDIASIPQIQRGTVNVTVSASTSGTATVTFPAVFDATPIVVCQVNSGSGTAIKATVLVYGTSATGCTVRVELSASTTFSCPVNWIAVEA